MESQRKNDCSMWSLEGNVITGGRRAGLQGHKKNNSLCVHRGKQLDYGVTVERITGV